MKRSVIIPIVFAFTSSLLSAQGIYIRAGAGYGLPLATSTIGEKYNYAYSYLNSVSTTTASSENVSASYGAGANFNLAFGYKFNENLIFDLGINYLAGKKFEVSNIYTDTYDTYSDKDEQRTTSYSRGLFFSPSLIFSVGFGKGAPYGKIGVITGSPKVIYNSTRDQSGEVTATRVEKWENSKGMALGFQTAVGMNWKLTEKLDIFTEINFVSLTYFPKEANLVESIYNGTSNLDQLTVSQKQKIFEKKFDPDAFNDGTKPLEQSKQSMPFSSVSVEAGLRFTLWKKSE